MLMLNIHILWSAPLQITVAIYLLWKELGPSILAGVALLLIMIPINIMVAKKSKALQVVCFSLISFLHRLESI